MRVKSFGFANYRSFDNDGVFFPDIRRINIFIGKNNCGKSNVLKFLRDYKIARSERDFLFNKLVDHHRGNSPSPQIIFSFTVNEIANWGKGYATELVKYKESTLRIRVDVSSGQASLADSELDAIRLHHLHHNLLGHGPSQISSPESYAIGIAKALGGVVRRQMDEFLDKVIYIPDIRYVRTGVAIATDGPTSSGFDGADIIAKLHEMQHPNPGGEAMQRQFETIQEFVRELLNDDSVHLEVTHSKDDILVNMHNTRLPLKSFGTGIHELVMLCSAFAIHNDHLVMIEEPELHLHPEMQRQLLKFIVERTNSTYFISTHSSVFLDENNGSVIYHVSHDGSRSEVNNCTARSSAFLVLDDLGYRASDLLQANAIIWVEGPSDRIYIRRWIELVDPSLVEGLHYSILFYGGSNLAHLSANGEAEGDFIDLLRVNRNAVVVIDRDGDSEAVALASRKERIRDELGTERCWITAGREIENYIPGRRIEEAIEEKTGKKLKVSFGKDDKIQAAIDRTNEGGRSPYDYENKKPTGARLIVKQLVEEDLNILDLKERVTELVALLWKCNGLAD